MAARVDEALASLRAQLDALEHLVRAASDEQWRRPCDEETWSVGLVALHVGRGLQRQADWIDDALYGAPRPYAFDWAETHALNAAFAAAHPLPRRSEVLELVEAGFDRMAAALGEMSDEELDRPAWTYEGTPWSALDTMRVARRHAFGHLESIRAALS